MQQSRPMIPHRTRLPDVAGRAWPGRREAESCCGAGGGAEGEDVTGGVATVVAVEGEGADAVG
jgi:hypothetical protein